MIPKLSQTNPKIILSGYPSVEQALLLALALACHPLWRPYLHIDPFVGPVGPFVALGTTGP